MNMEWYLSLENRWREIYNKDLFLREFGIRYDRSLSVGRWKHLLKFRLLRHKSHLLLPNLSFFVHQPRIPIMWLHSIPIHYMRHIYTSWNMLCENFMKKQWKLWSIEEEGLMVNSFSFILLRNSWISYMEIQRYANIFIVILSIFL